MFVRAAALIGLMAIFALPSSLNASLALQIENKQLLQNTPNQVVRILGTYDGSLPALNGVEFSIFIGRGGPDLLAPLPGLPGNVDGPNITSINLKPTGGVFSGFTVGQTVATSLSQFIQADIITDSTPLSTAFTDQLVALLIVDTTGVPLGAYEADLENTTLGARSTFLGGLDGARLTTLLSGTLTVIAVPEPGTILMLSLAGILTILYRRCS
jgi:hypothetical protein